MWSQLRKFFSVMTVTGLILSLVQPAGTQAQASSKPAPAAQTSASRKLLVDAGDSAAIRQLQQARAERLVDYGAFALWRAPESEAQKLLNRPGVTAQTSTRSHCGAARSIRAPGLARTFLIDFIRNAAKARSSGWFNSSAPSNLNGRPI